MSLILGHTVSGIIDTFLYHSIKLIREKIRLNKLS